MSVQFFEALANQISQKFGLGENTNKSFDIVENGTTKKYGQLGDFAGKFDQSSERRYLEEGYLRKDIFNADPKQLEILRQEPEITVLIKKKMFSTLAENFRPDLMDSEEKMFYKASRVLLANKCKQISAFEKLTKIERVSTTVGEFDTALVPIIINLFDELNATSVSSSGLFKNLNTNLNINKLSDVIEKIRKAYAFSTAASHTTWITDNNTLFRNELGEGTGVIELTTITSLNTTTSVNSEGGLSTGGGSLTIADPYKLMLITESDIERALADSLNNVYNHKIFKLGKESADDMIARNTELLNNKRKERGANPIIFKINPDTILGERVVALVDNIGVKINFTYDAALGLGGIGVGKGVQVSDDSKIGSEILGDDGLSDASSKKIPGLNVKSISPTSEISLFSDVIKSIFNKLQMEDNARTVLNSKNKEVNYARKKLRLFFLGKRIIQPLDQVHIYIGSKSSYDTKILSGLQNSFNAYGFLSNLNNSARDFKQSFDTLFKPSSNADFMMEKSAIVGSKFPNTLWSLMRNQFVNERSGAHVFAGVVDSCSGNYSDGFHTVSVGLKDNTFYFEQGYVNFKPSADVFNGALYDPLTPFKSKYDAVSTNFNEEIPDLLDENAKILNGKIARYSLGPNVGAIVTSANLFHDYDIDPKGFKRKVFYAPDGLVYRWKQGIGIFTQYGDSLDANDPNKLGNQSTTKEPFAGQDIMNVLSLLITGEPYNYANYFKATRDFDTHSRDPQSGQDAAFSFYSSLTNDLNKRNMLWGNFFPFKNLTVSEEAFSKILNGQQSIINANSEIDNKVRELADINNQLRSLRLLNEKDLNDKENRDKSSADEILKQKRQDLISSIKTSSDFLNQSFQDKNSGITFNIIGDDVSYETDEVFNTNSKNSSLTNPESRRLLRRKTNFLTRRLSWKVRSNDDKNLFIVDDYYDKDYDILAFEKSLTDGLSLYNSQFTTVKSKIEMVAKLINLEVFCDTQGHIRARPPQYNRIPSSIFYRMMELKDQKGIKLFPQFLEDLFVNQIDTAIKQINILENQIRFLGAVIGYEDDDSLVRVINSQKASPLGEGIFKFISNSQTLSIDAASDIIKNSNPEDKTDIFSQNILRGNILSSSVRFDVLSDFYSKNNQSINFQFNTTRLEKIRSVLIQESGQSIVLDDYLQKTADGTINVGIKTPDVYKTLKEISNNISKRQILVKTAYNMLKNLKESKALDDDDNLSNRLLTPQSKSNINIPEIFESMIEDESYDDLGPGSGKRFIIKNSMITSFTDSENPPEYTSVQVNGLLDPGGFQVDLPSDLNTFGNDGNALVTAVAVDYDMWRIYGFRSSTSIPAPFLHNPKSQCAPYASILLANARENVLQAEATLAGNEYMQPGEVVYVEDNGLLYYITSVSHNFSYGGKFSTSLKLKYGHPPGEYIPNPFDLFGKMIYLNKDNANLINYRQQNSLDQSSLGVLVFDTKNKVLSGESSETKDLLLNGGNGAHNSKVINDILNITSYKLQINLTNGSNVKSTIELRVYYDSSNPLNSDLKNAADIVKEILQGTIDANDGGLLNTLAKTSSKDLDFIKIVEVDLSDPSNQLSPSQKAIDASINLNTNKVFNGLYKSIIDCWIKIENVNPDTPGVLS